MNILFVNTPRYTGGAEVSLLTLMRNLDSSHYVPILLTSGEGLLSQTARKFGIETRIQQFFWFSKRYPWRYPASIIRLAYTLRDRKIALVHTNCDHSLRYVMYACRLYGIPYVSHVRDFVRAWFQPENVQALNEAAVVIANSKAIATACVNAGVNAAKIRVIYNPVEISRYNQIRNLSPRLIRIDLGLPADAWIVGIVGQIQAIKGHYELVKAAPSVLTKIPEAHFIVIGKAFDAESQRFRTKLVELISKLGLDSRFHFLGFRTDIPRIMRSLDVLAIPSWTESFGRTVVEGLAAGCPVIGTDVGGIPEIIQDGVNGLLIPPRDPNALAQAIVRIAQDEALQNRLREAGIRSARRFDVHRHVNQIQTVYDAVLRVENWRLLTVTRSKTTKTR